MDSPERPFAADYATTLDRLIDGASEAQDGRAVRIFQRFREAPSRGYEALHPRLEDPGVSPLVGGPLLDSRWHDDAHDLLVRAAWAEADLPADVDHRSLAKAQFLRGLAEILFACVDDSPYADAIRAEAYLRALEQLETASPDHVHFRRDYADERRAAWRFSDRADAVGEALRELDGDATDLMRSVRELDAAVETWGRARDRSVRSWARLRARRVRRPGIPSAVMHPRNRGRRRRAAARRAAGPRSGQDPGGNGKPVGAPPSLPADDEGAS